MTNNELQFDVVKNVTREFFVVPEDGTPLYLRFESPFVVDTSIEVRTRRTKAQIEGQDSAKPVKEPWEVADVTNLQTGELGRLIGNAVVKSELRANYPSESYVGKYFQFIQGASKMGKGGNKYRTFKITEIKIRDSSAPAKTAAKK